MKVKSVDNKMIHRICIIFAGSQKLDDSPAVSKYV